MAGFKDRYFQPMPLCQEGLIKAGNDEKGLNSPFPPCYRFWSQTMNPWLESTPGWAEPGVLLAWAGAVREQEQFLVLHPTSSAGQDSQPPVMWPIYIKIYTYLS